MWENKTTLGVFPNPTPQKHPTDPTQMQLQHSISSSRAVTEEEEDAFSHREPEGKEIEGELGSSPPSRKEATRDPYSQTSQLSQR